MQIDELTATAKAFIHHLASFFYIENKEIIIITTIWRAVSMSGHTAQAFQLKSYISADQLFRFNWVLSHARNAIVLYIYIRCCMSSDVRRGFGESAIGHVGYMLVRFGPVFRLGSCYVGDRALWQGYSDYQRLMKMLQGHHPFITIEIGSLVLLSLLFLLWKFYIK